MGHYSCVSRNVSLFCKLFCWSLSDYLEGSIDTGNGYLHKFSLANLTRNQLLTANYVLEIMQAL
jgi:hypothetical protein